jgi:hypothetical protein
MTRTDQTADSPGRSERRWDGPQILIAFGMVAGLAALVVAGCGGGGGSQKSYPADSIAAFMGACQTVAQQGGLTGKQGGDRCACVIQKMEATVRFEDFVAIENRLVAGDKTALSEKGIVDAVSACGGALAQAALAPKPKPKVTGDVRIDGEALRWFRVTTQAQSDYVDAFKQYVAATGLGSKELERVADDDMGHVDKKLRAQMKLAIVRMRAINPSSARGRIAKTLLLREYALLQRTGAGDTDSMATSISLEERADICLKSKTRRCSTAS